VRTTPPLSDEGTENASNVSAQRLSDLRLDIALVIG
jgi:hypothetical protein